MNIYLQILPQLIVDGLALGFVYAIIAVGYTMVYGILEFINFAHSEVFMVGAFVATESLLLMQSGGYLGTISPMFALTIAIFFAIAISGLLGFVVERVAYKPLRNSPKLVALISAIGVSFFLYHA